MAAGDVHKQYDYLAIDGYCKTNTAITKGTLCDWNGDGFAAATDAVAHGFVVALDDKAAVASTQYTLKWLAKGVVEIYKVTTMNLKVGDCVMPSATAGAVTKWIVSNAIDAGQNLGMVLEEASTTATTVKVLFSGGY